MGIKGKYSGKNKGKLTKRLLKIGIEAEKAKNRITEKQKRKSYEKDVY